VLQPTSLPQSRVTSLAKVRALEMGNQLRAAVVAGDEARIAVLLSTLLRISGLTRGQRVRVQQRALTNLVHALRSLALTDEATGLHNRRGFVQTATRLLDLSVRDGQAAHLVYFRLASEGGAGSAGPSDDETLLRQLGNVLRDLFPSYGVYEVLGRLSAREFAALTANPDYASRHAILRQAPQRDCELQALRLSVGVAHFDPLQPLPIDELLQCAAAVVSDPEHTVSRRSVRGAPAPYSAALAPDLPECAGRVRPPPDLALC
jgi:GGDEF domain-containing protein